MHRSDRAGDARRPTPVPDASGPGTIQDTAETVALRQAVTELRQAMAELTTTALLAPTGTRSDTPPLLVAEEAEREPVEASSTSPGGGPDSLRMPRRIVSLLAAAGLLMIGLGLVQLSALHLLDPGSDAPAAGPEKPRLGAPAVTPSPPTAGSEPAAPTPEPDRRRRVAATGLQIPAVSLDVGLQQVGLQADGVLGPPSSPSEAGWYTGSAAPGDVGLTVIVGHVDSKRGPGVFFRLDDLQAGDQATIERSDGRLVAYRVTTVEYYPKERFPTDQVYRPTSTSQLRLITCGGEFDYRSGSYEYNVVVYATASG
jgi:Sortase domain